MGVKVYGPRYSRRSSWALPWAHRCYYNNFRNCSFIGFVLFLILLFFFFFLKLFSYSTLPIIRPFKTEARTVLGISCLPSCKSLPDSSRSCKSSCRWVTTFCQAPEEPEKTIWAVKMTICTSSAVCVCCEKTGQCGLTSKSAWWRLQEKCKLHISPERKEARQGQVTPHPSTPHCISSALSLEQPTAKT